MEVPYYIVAERPDKLWSPGLPMDSVAKLTPIDLYVLQYLYTLYPNQTNWSDYMDVPSLGKLIANDINLDKVVNPNAYRQQFVYHSISRLDALGFLRYEVEYIMADEDTEVVLIKYMMRFDDE